MNLLSVIAYKSMRSLFEAVAKYEAGVGSNPNAVTTCHKVY